MGKKSQKIEVGEPGYINQNCWLVRSLNYTPYKRCQYCELNFRECTFLHYQIISAILIIFSLLLSFFTGVKNLEIIIFCIFTSVIVYGYFFTKITDKIIETNFFKKKAEEKAMKEKILRDEAEKLNQAKSEFIALVSHQLRTPLTIIKGYLSMVLDGSYGKLSNSIKEKIESIYQMNERLIKLVNDVLNVSKIEVGEIEMNWEKEDLREIIKEVISELLIKAEEKGIYLNFEEPKEFPKVLLDREKIRQVILNLVDNAIRYTQKGGVTVRLQIANDRVQIVVSDTGEGLTKEEKEKLFEMFSRGTAGTKFWTEGAGLGLYIARRFVEMHNGKIWAESEGKGKGSTFYVELPMK
jgi:signal transduction histidine kinase